MQLSAIRYRYLRSNGFPRLDIFKALLVFPDS